VKFNIHYKITLIITATVAIILSGIYYYLNTSLQKDTYQRIYENLSKGALLAKLYIEEASSSGLGGKDFDEMADKIANHLNARVTVVKSDGTVIGDSELNPADIIDVENHLYRPEIQQALKNGFGQSRRFSTTIQKDMLYMAYPFDQKEFHGVIRLAIPLSEINFISSKLKGLLVFSLFIAFAVSIVMGFGASLFISAPIKHIASVANSIAHGDYSRKIIISTNDEIRDLGQSINHMSDEIKRRIEEITSHKLRFEAVLLSMFEGVMVIDGNGVIILMNGTLRKLLSINQDPKGRKPLEIIRNIELQTIADNVLKNTGTVETREITVFVPDEKIIQIHATSVLRDNSLDGAVLVFHDMTALRKLELVRRDFVANVSHEIKTPLTNIKGYIETLMDGALDDKNNAKNFLKIINDDSERLTQLVDDLLDLSKIESGKLQMDLKYHSVESIVQRVMASMEKQAKERDVTLSSHIPSNLPQIKIDIDSITQVMLNLINNGIKYNRKGGSVTVSVKDSPLNVQIEISDTGIGIPEEDLPRIFERFYRVDKARSRELGGTGLGLSIVRHIVQAHNGDVTVESQINQGTTFRVKLPK